MRRAVLLPLLALALVTGGQDAWQQACSRYGGLANGTLSDAGCHAVNLALADGRAVARGATGQNHPRNAPGPINVACQATLDWTNPAPRTLAQQMHASLFGTQPVEMGVNDANRDVVLQRIRNDTSHPGHFAAAFPDDPAPLHWDDVIKAISSFQRTLVSAGGRYGQALAGEPELTAAEQRGLDLYQGDRAPCARCHGGPKLNGAFLTQSGLQGEPQSHNIGLFNIGGTGDHPQAKQGVFECSGQAEDMGRFRAPSLRNLALTGPYLHNGSVATVAAALDMHAADGRIVGNSPYAGDGRSNPCKNP